MSKVMHQMSARAERMKVGLGEAQRDFISDETCGPTHRLDGTGSGLLLEVLTRENLQRAMKRVKANKGAAGVDGMDIGQTMEYGYRRITAELCRSGRKVNHKTVQRLMQLQGLKSLVRPKKYRSYRGAFNASVPNILDRKFIADRPNSKWVTDVTEFKVKGEKLYLSPVLDLFNGEIIAYETQENPKMPLISEMLKKALSKLSNQEAPLLHSDQGWQYQMPSYRRQLAARGVTQSMSRKGNCLDNAAMESFFGTLKSEYFYLNKFESVKDLAIGLKEYIDYYNNDRIKTKLKGLSPVQYRTQPSVA